VGSIPIPGIEKKQLTGIKINHLIGQKSQNLPCSGQNDPQKKPIFGANLSSNNLSRC
jgi:hypothetical protein